MKHTIFSSIFLLFFSAFTHAQSWSMLGTGTHALKANNTIGALCPDTGGIIYASGGFSDSLIDPSGRSYVVKWDGTSWSPLGNLRAYGIYSLCMDDDHNLYAGAPAGDTGYEYNVFKWDGVSWSELGSGSTGLNTNAAINSICADHLGNIYAAGQFTDSPTQFSGHQYVAKWDGAAWSELGTGSNALNANDDIMAITVDKANNIYASGNFWHPGGYNYVAKWDGTSWSTVGTGVNQLTADEVIWSLNVDTSGNIYAGGFFRNSAGYYYVAKWDGTSWSELGAGSMALNSEGEIQSISSDTRGNVYTAYYNSLAQKHNMAKWDGTSWTKMGLGTNGLNANSMVFATCVDKEFNVYAAGDFTDSINGYGNKYVAVYNDNNTGITVINKEMACIKPNPAANSISIAITDKLIGANFVLTDATGRIVDAGKFQTLTTTLNISDLTPGEYFLQAGQSITAAIKVIKQ